MVTTLVASDGSRLIFLNPYDIDIFENVDH